MGPNQKITVEQDSCLGSGRVERLLRLFHEIGNTPSAASSIIYLPVSHGSDNVQEVLATLYTIIAELRPTKELKLLIEAFDLPDTQKEEVESKVNAALLRGKPPWRAANNKSFRNNVLAELPGIFGAKGFNGIEVKFIDCGPAKEIERNRSVLVRHNQLESDIIGLLQSSPEQLLQKDFDAKKLVKKLEQLSNALVNERAKLLGGRNDRMRSQIDDHLRTFDPRRETTVVLFGAAHIGIAESKLQKKNVAIQFLMTPIFTKIKFPLSLPQSKASLSFACWIGNQVASGETTGSVELLSIPLEFALTNIIAAQYMEDRTVSTSTSGNRKLVSDPDVLGVIARSLMVAAQVPSSFQDLEQVCSQCLTSRDPQRRLSDFLGEYALTYACNALGYKKFSSRELRTAYNLAESLYRGV